MKRVALLAVALLGLLASLLVAPYAPAAGRPSVHVGLNESAALGARAGCRQQGLIFPLIYLNGLSAAYRADRGVGAGFWEDQTGRAGVVKAPTIAASPALNTSGGPNGQAYLAFTAASSQTLFNTASAIGPTLWTIYAVWSSITASASDSVVGFGISAHGNIFKIDASKRDILCDGVSARYDSSSTTSAEIWIATNDGTTTLFWLNGTLTALANSTTNATATSQQQQNVVIGASLTHAADFHNGKIEEVGAATRQFSSTEVTTLSRYLGARYNISVP